MLSDKITTLKDSLAVYRDCGCELSPQAVVAICVLLADFADEAWHLNQARVSPVAQAGFDLPANVVRIAAVLARKGVRVGVHDGGDAA